MRTHRAALVFTLVMAVAGCAGPSALNRSGDTVTVATSQHGDLGGIWEGSYAWPGGSYWPDDANCLVRIDEDGTFTATVVPTPGANNLAKPSKWAGTVGREGDLVALRVPQGPTLTLYRSGERLYGVARDPAVGVPVVVELERVSRT